MYIRLEAHFEDARKGCYVILDHKRTSAPNCTWSAEPLAVTDSDLGRESRKTFDLYE